MDVLLQLMRDLARTHILIQLIRDSGKMRVKITVARSSIRTLQLKIAM